MYYGKDFSTVTPSEIFDAWFDFANDFRRGSSDTIVSAVFSLALSGDPDDGATVDPAPSGQLSGSPSYETSEISGRQTIAVQRVDTCVAGNRYRISCLATMASGMKLDAHSYFWCRSPS
jgi:hypothetical protein